MLVVACLLERCMCGFFDSTKNYENISQGVSRPKHSYRGELYLIYELEKETNKSKIRKKIRVFHKNTRKMRVFYEKLRANLHRELDVLLRVPLRVQLQGPRARRHEEHAEHEKYAYFMKNTRKIRVF